MLVAEREGFEPPEACTSTVFKTAAFDHSATSPSRDSLTGFGGHEKSEALLNLSPTLHLENSAS